MRVTGLGWIPTKDFMPRKGVVVEVKQVPNGSDKWADGTSERITKSRRVGDVFCCDMVSNGQVTHWRMPKCA